MAAPPIDDIEREILAGMPNARKRLDDALYNLEFYNGDFSRFPVRRPDEENGDRSRKRTSLIMQRTVNVLTENLYRAGPKRTLQDAPDASEWLEAVYKANAADALWQQADRWTLVGDAALIQVEPTANVDRPIRLRVWDASSFEVWTDPNEPTEAAAVAILDKYDNRRRIRLWTPEEVRVYATEKLMVGQTSGGTAYRRVSAIPNGLGVTPFAFVHFNYPACEFWSGGPGSYLRSVNDVANAALTDGFDSISVNLLPILMLRNVRAGFAPKRLRPGAIWDLPGEGGNVTRDVAEPSAEYLQANPAYVAASWEDLQSYLDHVLEMLGVPPAAVRMIQDSARSGVSIVAEQIPLITWAEGRQRPFGYYEADLARVVLQVGARHLGAQAFGTMQATAAQLMDAVEAPLTLDWPDLYPRMPGPDTDASDQWELDNGLESRVSILMRRKKWKREEAEAHLEQVAADLKRERAMFGEPDPKQQQQPDPKQPTPPAEDDAEDGDMGADDGEEEA
jgi:hypothetical protein